MPKHVKGSKVFITDQFSPRYNLNRQVKLLEWVEPHTVLNFVNKFAFPGGSTGAWVVAPVDGKSIVAKGPNGISMISSVALIKDENLSAVFLENQAPLTVVELDDLRELTNTGPNYLLTREEFEAFEKMLESNPLSENKPLQELLSKPTPWS